MIFILVKFIGLFFSSLKFLRIPFFIPIFTFKLLKKKKKNLFKKFINKSKIFKIKKKKIKYIQF